MRKLLLVLTLLATSLVASPDDVYIDEFKNDIYFLNTLFQTQDDAEKSKDTLERIIKNDKYGGDQSKMNSELSFELAYNTYVSIDSDINELFLQLADDGEANWYYYKKTLENIISYLISKGAVNVLGLSQEIIEKLGNIDFSNDEFVENILKTDISNHINLYKKSIEKGHGVIVVAHGQGESFAAQETGLLIGKTWHDYYYSTIGVAPISSRRGDFNYIKTIRPFHNDLYAGFTSTKETTKNPNSLKNKYYDDKGEEFILENPPSTIFHDFNYYMGESIVVNDMSGTRSIKTPIVKEQILKNIYSFMKKHDNRMSQWGVIEEKEYGTREYRIKVEHSFNKNIKIDEPIFSFFDNEDARSSKIRKLYGVIGVDDLFSFEKSQYVYASKGGVQIAEEWEEKEDNQIYKLLKTDPSQFVFEGCQRPEKSVILDKSEVNPYTKEWRVSVFDAINNETVKNVIPFSNGGSLYKVYKDSYKYDFVKAKCGGVSIVESNETNICYELKDTNGTTIDTLSCDCKQILSPKYGYIEVTLDWVDSSIDMDLSVQFPIGEHDIKDKACPTEHFYAKQETQQVKPGTYPVKIKYKGELNASLKDLNDITLTIKIPGKTQTSIVSYNILDSLKNGGHIADIEVDEQKSYSYKPSSEVKHTVVKDTSCSNCISSGGPSYIYNILWHLSQLIKGPIVDADVTLYKAKEFPSNPIFSTKTLNSLSLNSAGVFIVNSDITDALNNSTYYILKATGGSDIDANDDGIVDTTPTKNLGSLHSVVSSYDLKNFGTKINILTQLSYELVKDDLNLSHEELSIKLDSIAKCFIGKDIYRQDNEINYLDLLLWVPTKHKNNLNHDYNFKNIGQKILKNQSVYQDALNIYRTPKLSSEVIYITNTTPVNSIIGKLSYVCGEIKEVRVNELFSVDKENNIILKSTPALGTHHIDIQMITVQDEVVFGSVRVNVSHDGVPLLSKNEFQSSIIDTVLAPYSLGRAININDGGSEITDIYLQGDGASNFMIDKDGYITISKQANIKREDILYNLEIVAINKHGNSAPFKITIKVFMKDELKPILEPLTLYINKNSVSKDKAIGKILQTTSKHCLIDKFEIDDNSLFYIEKDGGIYVKSIPNDIGYLFSVYAKSSCGDSNTVALKINFSGFIYPPVIKSETFNVDENSPKDTFVGNLSISSDSPIKKAALLGVGVEKFSVDLNGTIRVAKDANLDYESKMSYVLSVVVKNDIGSNAATVTININDLFDSPPVIDGRDMHVDENSPSETFVGQISIDEIYKDSITSIVLSRNGAENFKVYNNGTIVVAEGADIDYEKIEWAEYSLDAVAYNEFGAGNSVRISMYINNVLEEGPPILYRGQQTFYVYDNFEPGIYVGQIDDIHTDGLPIDSFTLSGAGAENFKIDNNGSIFISDSALLDFDVKRDYIFSIYANNSFGASNTMNITIYLKKRPIPQPYNAHFSTHYSLPINSKLGTLSLTYSNCNILEYKVGDTSVVNVRDNGEVYTTSNLTKWANYSTTVYAKSSCGDSEVANITIDTKKRVISIIGPINYQKDIAISSDDSKIFSINNNRNNFQISDVMDPHSIITTSIYSSGASTSIALLNNKAYITKLNNGLLVYDISNKTAPVLINSVFTNSPQDVVVSKDGTKAFIADGEFGIKIVDISSSDFYILGYLETSNAIGVKLSFDETKLFIADGSAGVKIVDVSNPSNPTLIGSFDTYGANKLTPSHDGTKLFIADGYEGIKIVDISNHSNITLISSLKTGNAYDLAVSNDETKIFVGNYCGSSNYNNEGFNIIDIADIDKPVNIEYIHMCHTDSVVLSSDNKRAYLSNYYGGTHIIDIEDFISNKIPPTLQSTTLSVDENSPFETFVGEIEISYNSETVTSIVLSGNGAENFKVYNNGTVVVAQGADIDYEKSGYYSLSAVAKNEFGASNSVIVMINVNDLLDSPPIISDYYTYFDVDENSPSGIFVGNLLIYDKGSPITSISLSGNGAENFKVYNNGTIVLASGADIDYEKSGYYSLSAVAKNEFGASNSVGIQININNLPDTPPVIKSATLSVDENSSSETFVGNLNIDDDDSPITSISLSGNGAENFKVYNNGTVVVAQGADIDYEKIRTYSLSAVAYNEFGVSNSVNIGINLNNIPDSPPYIEGAIIIIDKDAPSTDIFTFLRINTDSELTSIKLFGSGSSNFNIALNGVITISSSADFEYFNNEEIHYIYAIGSNEFGDGNNATIQIIANRGSNESPPVLSDISFLTFGSSIEQDEYIGYYYPSSMPHCKILNYVVEDNPYITIENYEDTGHINVIAPIANNTIQTLSFYANSSCGISNSVNLTIDTKERIKTYETNNFFGGTLIPYETKVLLISQESNKAYMVDLKDERNNQFIDLVDEDKKIALSVVSEDKRYLYLSSYTDYGFYEFTILDISQPLNPVQISTIDVGQFDPYSSSMKLFKDESKILIATRGSFTIIDVSNPLIPTLLNKRVFNETLDFMFKSAAFLTNDDKTLFIPDIDGNVLLKYDISNPTSISNPSSISILNQENLQIFDISEDGSKIYGAFNNGLGVYDITDNNRPYLIGAKNNEDSLYVEYIRNTTRVGSDRVLMSSISFPFFIVDFSNPKYPSLAVRVSDSSQFYLYLDRHNKYFMSAKKVFVLSDSGLTVLDLEGYVE